MRIQGSFRWVSVMDVTWQIAIRISKNGEGRVRALQCSLRSCWWISAQPDTGGPPGIFVPHRIPRRSRSHHVSVHRSQRRPMMHLLPASWQGWPPRPDFPRVHRVGLLRCSTSSAARICAVRLSDWELNALILTNGSTEHLLFREHRQLALSMNHFASPIHSAAMRIRLCVHTGQDVTKSPAFLPDEICSGYRHVVKEYFCGGMIHHSANRTYDKCSCLDFRTHVYK